MYCMLNLVQLLGRNKQTALVILTLIVLFTNLCCDCNLTGLGIEFKESNNVYLKEK